MMQTLYIIGDIKRLTQTEIQNIENLVSFPLPTDYTGFLNDYGLGGINELILISQPDEKHIRLNFKEDMDFWELTPDEEQKILNGLTIATTIDGDILLVVDNKENPVVILPRHSSNLLKFSNFSEVITYYNHNYALGDNLYFDSSCDHKQEQIDMLINGKFDNSLIGKIERQFLENYSYDMVYNRKSQPKYIIQKMGGWVYFDNVYHHSIRIKYQTRFKEEAEKIIASIRNYKDLKY